MSQHQPGPYGAPQQPPQQPGPYGQGGAQPGYGYPQQPPSPYGAPPQPGPYGAPAPGPYGAPQPGSYGAQGQPGPYGVPQQPGPYGAAYGQPGMPGPYPPPVPPKQSNTGKAIGIALGAVILVGAIVAGGFVLLAGGKDGGGTTAADGKRYKLTAPDAILAGEYKKDPDAHVPAFGAAEKTELRQIGVADPESISGAYQTDAPVMTQKRIRFMGAWGTIKRPEGVVDGMFLSLRTAIKKGTNDNMELIGSAERVSPAGLDDGAVMKCQQTRLVGTTAPGGKPITMQMCVWADHSTTAMVLSLDQAAVLAGRQVPLEQAAELTAKARRDVRVEIPKQ
ncbi:hypothetical protein [Streptomyces sp. NPDC049585]|uniref:hypothetical protein n=1 Tax=Streptomyces sp. NPDC049585 TaxID=3155154 RepID=UPI003423F26A